ncbi:MAG: response regulator, partial [Gammaproteobacteria bacterium]|nr:response regulator [Gammaproteobacteria bacterium]
MSPKHPEKSVIFIVEDNPDTIDLLCEHLHEAGFKTLVARSGEGALRQVDFARPDLIVLDVKLPGIDGFETCRRLKQKETTKAIPVIFITALSDTVDKVKGFDAGGADYLTKPFQSEEVLARVNTQLTIRKFQQQLQEQNVLLEEQNARFQKLSEATFEGIMIHDRGNIVEVNRALEKIFGYQRSEVIGKNVSELIASASRDIVQQHITSGDEYPYETEAVRKNGEIFPVEARAATIPYQGREVKIAAVRDLSWHKAMEEKRASLEKENIALKTTIKDRYKFGEIIGKSPAMQDIYELIASASASDAHVTISGESGTGKELVAHTIHQLSDRRKQAFVPVNC